MRWPAGDAWLRPTALDLLRDTPINTLILPLAAAGQNTKPLLDEARRRGIALVALADGNSDPGAAGAAGFDAVASPEASGSVIPWTPRGGMPRNSAAPVVAVTESVWPAVRSGRMMEEATAAPVEAGPTGLPWVDSNGWFIQMARVLAPGKGIWIVVDPPAKLTTLRAETYALAVADAAAYGGRWIVTLDDAFASGLSGTESPAVSDWKALASALKFFAVRQQWSGYSPISNVAVVSDFLGNNEFLSTELLNLLPRRQVPFRVIEKSALRTGALDGLKMVIYADGEAPAGALREQLLAFAKAGGLLVCTKNCAALASGSAVTAAHGRFQVYTAGSGRIAVSTEDQMDPYVCAGDAQILLSRRFDQVRLWNLGAANTYYAGSASGRSSAVLSILNYTRRPVTDMSVQFARQWRSARFWSLATEQAQPVELVKRPAGVEVRCPQFAVFCAVELEG
jgi:hypothetical protein